MAAYIAQREPGRRGFSAQNLWRMRQFFEAYPVEAKLSTLLRVLPWSSHLHILSRSKRAEEREFYRRMAAQQRWQVREVARQIDSGLPDKRLLAAKLHEFYALGALDAEVPEPEPAPRTKKGGKK